MTWRSATTRCLSVAAVVLAGLATPSTASVASGDGVRHINYDLSRQLTGGRAPCDPTTPGRCVGTFENVITYTGDVTGTSYAVGSAALAPDGIYRATAIEQFSGTITGCGTGTVIIQQIGTLDPATGRSDGSWTIVAGAGSGDLAETTGSSTGRGADTQGEAWIRCG